MTINENSYEKSNLNVELFSKAPSKMNEYFRSVKHYFTKDYIKDNYSFLDIGGAGGNLAHAIKSEIADIKATIIDPDRASIEEGKQKYPEFDFIQGYFPKDFNLSSDYKFDIVSMQALFPHIPDWKEVLLSIRKYTKKYINLGVVVKY